MSLNESNHIGSDQSDSAHTDNSDPRLHTVSVPDESGDDQDGGRSSEDEVHNQSNNEMKIQQERPCLDFLIEESCTDDCACWLIERAHESIESIEEWKTMINTPNSDELRETPLHIAAGKGFVKAANLLLDDGADIHARDGSQMQPLHIACDGGYDELVKVLCDRKANVAQYDEDGWCPIHFAAREGLEADTIRRLLGSNEFIDEIEYDTRWTPLNIAAFWGNKEVVSTLLERGAAAASQDCDGWTPLMAAVKRRHYEIFDLLLSHLKNHRQEDIVNIQDFEGRTVLMELFAATVNDDINDDQSPKVRASITKLLELSPTVDVTDCGRQTALHYATTFALSTKDSSLTLKTLDLAKNGTLLLKDEQGRTALDVAFDANPNANSPDEVWHKMIDHLNKGNLRNELLCCLVQREAMHDEAKKLLIQKGEKVDHIPESDKWGLVEWVIFRGLPQVLMSYVTAIRQEDAGSNQRIFKETKEVRDKLIEWLGEPGNKNKVEWLREPENNSVEGLGNLKNKNNMQLLAKQEDKKKKPPKSSPLPTRERMKKTDNLEGESGRRDEDQVLRDIKDILDFFLIEKTTRSKQSPELSKPNEGMKKSLTKFRAAVIQMGQDGRGFTRFVKFRQVEEVVYNKDVRLKTTGETKKRFEKLLPRPDGSAKPATQGGEGFGGEFTWIHLPSTNVSLPVN